MQKMEFEEQNMKWSAHGTPDCHCVFSFHNNCNISEKDRVGLLNCTKYVNPTVYGKLHLKRVNWNIYNIQIKGQNPSFPVLEANPLQLSGLSWRFELNLTKSWTKSWDHWPELSLFIIYSTSLFSFFFSLLSPWLLPYIVLPTFLSLFWRSKTNLCLTLPNKHHKIS